MRLLAPIENTLTRGLLLWFTSESYLKTLLHKTLSDIANGIAVTVERLGDIVVSLIGTIGINLEQNISVFDPIGWSFACRGECDELLALLVAESDNIFFVHVAPPSFM